jgi:threonine synthase
VYWLHVRYEAGKIEASRLPDSNARSLWRYASRLPLSKEENVVSLGEGWTPLIKCRGLASTLGLNDLYVKNEGVNPTFSFKDREVSVSISMAKELGLVPVAMASSGNAGSALSAYSARGGVKSVILTPEYTPDEKTVQMTIYGSTVLKIKGTIEHCRRLVGEGSRRFHWTPFNTSILRSFAIEGTKTIAFEIFEQLDQIVPDTIVVPTGSGRGCMSIWKGFAELQAFGLISRVPKFVSVQPSSLHPIADAINGKVGAATGARSIATALLVQNPPDLDLVVNAVKSTGGHALTVSDNEILGAEMLLAQEEGIFAEPSAASSIAALVKLKESGELRQDERIVCVVTGCGLKDTASARKATKQAPVLEPNLDSIAPYIGH